MRVRYYYRYYELKAYSPAKRTGSPQGLCVYVTAKNGSVPVFYQSILRELRTDLDTLTSGLHTVTNEQLAVASTDKQAQARRWWTAQLGSNKQSKTG